MSDALGELLVFRELGDLACAYCYHFDNNEPEAVAELFTEDARIDYGPEVEPIVGRERIAPAIAVGLRERFLATSHHLSNMRISLEAADAATAIAYVYAWHRYRDGSPDGELWGRYHYRFRRTDAGWKIAELVLRAAGTKHFHRDRMHGIGRRQSDAPASD
ncbi:MAG TPA: nuclear transport factor 2 family protein [Gaiellaceae bacterium]|nr:nuclear transport factor 2 family protein [Gaiellaceae bacterium]